MSFRQGSNDDEQDVNDEELAAAGGELPQDVDQTPVDPAGDGAWPADEQTVDAVAEAPGGGSWQDDPMTQPDETQEVDQAGSEEYQDAGETDQPEYEPAPAVVAADAFGDEAAGAPARTSGRLKRLLAILVVGALFGVAGYMIRPQIAGSAPAEEQAQLASVRAQVDRAQARANKLQGELAAVREGLASANKQAQASAQAEKQAQEKIAVAEKVMAGLNEQLQQAKTANGPMMRELASAQKAASDSKAQAAEAVAKTEQYQQELAVAAEQRDKLTAARKQWQAQKAKLEKDLAGQQKTAANMKRLLDALNLGEGPDGSAEPAGLAEMPLTVAELVSSLGHPTLQFQQGDAVHMRWGGEHKATSVNGVVTSFDEQPATRAGVAQAGSGLPAAAAPPAPWRVAQGQALHYADLVAMFGRPEGTAGTGRRFTAWWSVGAWARRVMVTVSDGVVTRFDGRAVNPGEVCSLARHRPEAYQGGAEGGPAATLAPARACYRYALETLIPSRLKTEAERKARDGIRLVSWSLAPFNSVGTWIAHTNTPAGSITMRAALDCTWSDAGGDSRAERRYVIVTLVTDEEGKVQPAEYASLAARE